MSRCSSSPNRECLSCFAAGGSQDPFGGDDASSSVEHCRERRAHAVISDEESLSDEVDAALLLTRTSERIRARQNGFPYSPVGFRGISTGFSQEGAHRSQSDPERFLGEATAVHEFMNSKHRDGLFAASCSAFPAGVRTRTRAAAAASCRSDYRTVSRWNIPSNSLQTCPPSKPVVKALHRLPTVSALYLLVDRHLDDSGVSWQGVSIAREASGLSNVLVFTIQQRDYFRVYHFSLE